MELKNISTSAMGKIYIYLCEFVRSKSGISIVATFPSTQVLSMFLGKVEHE